MNERFLEIKPFTLHLQRVGVVDGVSSADSLNEHYAKISTDDNYAVPLCKQSAREQVVGHVTVWCVFQALDNLRPTAIPDLTSCLPGFWGWGRQPLRNLYHTSSTFHSPPPLFLPSGNLPTSLKCLKSRPQKLQWLPPNIYHLCAIKNYWTHCGSPFPVSSFSVLAILSKPLRPVWLPTIRIHDCCPHLNSPQRHITPPQQWLRCCYRSGFQRGIWHGPPPDPARQDGSARPSRWSL